MSPIRTRARSSPEYNIFTENIRFSGHVMASSIDLLTKINDEFLTCQICFETYTRPKSLSCQHTFCLRCLEEYKPPSSPVIICPTCRSEQHLGPDGVDGLKDNFFILNMADMLKTVKEIRSEDKDGSLMCDTCDHDNRNSAIARCLDCTDFLCSECATWHVRTKLTRRHKIVSLSEFESGMHNQELKSRAKIYCTIHEGEAAKIYCQSCRCPICHECVESEHARHRRCTLKEEVFNQGRQIENLMKTGKEKAEVLQSLQEALKDLKQKRKLDREAAEQEIEKTCDIFINAIHRRKQELVDDLHNMHAVEVNNINTDEDSIEMQLSSLLSCAEFSRKVLEYGTPKEVLGLNSQMTRILQQLLETHPALAYHEVDHTDVVLFEANADSSVRVIRDNLGRLSRQKVPHKEDVNKVLRRLDSFCSSSIDASMKQRKSHVFEREESCTETRLLHQIGKQGIGDGEFESTPSLAVNSVNEIISADLDGGRVQIFDQEGNFKDSFATELHKKKCKPAGLAVLHNDDVAVCCEDQVHVWSHEGKSVLGFGKGFFGNCVSVAVNTDNQLVVADVGRHCVSVHTGTGRVVTQFGAQGKGESKLIEPRCVACDSQNNIIVSDGGDCSVKKFSATGEFLLSFGSEGPERGQFQGPRGVCTDEQDNILVADCWNHRIDLFTPDGCFLRHIAAGADSLHFPWCLALTSNGRLVVSEDYSWSIKIFELPEYRHGSSISSGEETTSPASLMPDFEQLASQFDIHNLLSSKGPWWLTSPTEGQRQAHGDLMGGIHNTIATSSVRQDKPFPRKKSSNSDSDLTKLPPSPPPPPQLTSQYSNDVDSNITTNENNASLKSSGSSKVSFSGIIASHDDSSAVAMVNGT